MRRPAPVMTLSNPDPSLSITPDIQTLLAPVAPGLLLVEAKMKEVDSALFAPLASAFVDLIGSGGKRLRPALALMAAELNGAMAETPTYDRVVALAASVEMLHTASLVHDDVIDDALLRRGAPTLNAVWNKGSTVLAGNYMFGRSAYFSAQTKNMRVIRIFSDTLQVIVNGELRQLFARNDYHQDKDEYYRRIYAKTASLFCAATEGAAILADMTPEQIERLRSFGYNFGMAFQIVDDILDFTGSTGTLGKPAGSDLRQGTLTLPFFYFLRERKDPDLYVAMLEERFAQGLRNDSQIWLDTVDQIVADLHDGNAIEDARREAWIFLEEAGRCLAPLPECLHKESLLGLCDFVLQRTF